MAFISESQSQGHINHTYANASQRDPKILMTTSWDPSAPLIQFAKVGLAFFFTYHIIQINFSALLCSFWWYHAVLVIDCRFYGTRVHFGDIIEGGC